MAILYFSSVTFDGVYKNPDLRTEIVAEHVISCMPQYIEWLERGNHPNDSDLKSFLLLISNLTSQIRDSFEIVLLQFCSHNPMSREYFLKSDALWYVRDRLMRKLQSSFLLTTLYFLDKSETVSEFRNRLISCGVLVLWLGVWR
ncbi:hypothetical protein BS47DRAFT_1341782 [Hydnum rufescens UP504]|uniref:Uncharacterized protein n=1 Tax=Hydnum rufescens UP504 TaxID=1448309 RepID=A0A9P6DUQ3_9AGAM|nr:hypothetical protein BS47DRAFT_1341782 [Hydnum rufescens UP504]